MAIIRRQTVWRTRPDPSLTTWSAPPAPVHTDLSGSFFWYARRSVSSREDEESDSQEGRHRVQIVHGTWIPEDTDAFVQRGAFYVWVETDTPLTPAGKGAKRNGSARSRTAATASDHPR